jgi:hypothetical protein
MFLISFGFSQGYINNGASTIISSGTYLVVDGNFVNNTNVANGNVNLEGTIKVNGNWVNNASAGGVLSSIDNDGTVLFNGTTTFSGTSTAPFDFENLSVAPASTVTINANVPVTVNTNIVNGGTINVKSIAAGNGSLLVKGTVSGSGLYKVDRFLTANKWHLVSSPITNALSGVFLKIYLKAYNEATNTFDALITPTTIPMPVGKGFSVWTYAANEIRTFSGTVNNGTVTPAVQLTGTAGIGTGWNLIGNPYPSAIDWNAASGWTKTGIANSVYVWNNNQYATYVGGIGSNGGSRYIAMEQGFFVQTTSASANISMNNNVRVHNTVGYLKTDEEEPADILRVKVNMGVNSDEAVIAIRDNGSDIFNFETDAVKLPGNATSPQMHTIKSDNSQLAISVLTQIENIVGKYVYVDYAETGIHQLLYTHTLTGTTIPRLFDTKTLTVVEPNSPYSFQATIGESSARFQFIESLPMSINNPQNNSNLAVWESNNSLFIVCATDEVIKQVSVYSVEGNLVCQGIQSSYDISYLSKAMYLVKVITNKQIVTKKIIRK